MPRIRRTPMHALFLCAVLLAARPATAALRIPQVPVSGTALQDLFDARSANVDVQADQDEKQVWASLLTLNFTGSSNSIMLELLRKDPGTSIGLYFPADATFTPYLVFPPEAQEGWFAVVTFRTGPVRTLVHVFDASAALLGTISTPGGDANAFGFYVSGPAGTYLSEDARNPGGGAQWLAYRGVGIDTHNWWLAGESADVLGVSDRDYDDVVLFFEPGNSCACPVNHCSWGSLKARFR